MQNLQSAMAFSAKINPYTGWAFNHPHYKAGRTYTNADERYLDQFRFCHDKDLQDFVKSGVDLAKPKNEARLKKLALKLQGVVVKMERKAGFESWYGDLFDIIFADNVKAAVAPQAAPTPVAVPQPIPATVAAPKPTVTPAVAPPPSLLSGEELAKRFMAELVSLEFLAEIAEHQPGGAEMMKAISARGEAVILGLKDQAEPEAYAAFYAAYREQHPAPTEPELVVAEASIIETVIHETEPAELADVIDHVAAHNEADGVIAEKIQRAARLVRDGKRKNRSK